MSATIGQFIWPVFIVILVVLLKEQIKEVLKDPRLKRMKGGPGGFEIEFNNELDNVEKDLNKAAEVKTPELVAPEPVASRDMSNFREEIERLAEVSPRSAVLESHVLLEQLLRGAVGYKSNNFVNMRRLIKEAAEDGIVSSGEASALMELSHLRNRVAHQPDEPVSFETAMRYAEFAAEIAGSLRWNQPSPQADDGH